MNELDDKVIVDRMLAKAVLDILDANCASFSAHEREELRHALAADLTGWAAVPVEATDEQLHQAWMSSDGIENWGVARDAYAAMLAASPSLLEGVT